MKFSREEKRQSREVLLSVRLTPQQMELIDGLAKALEIEGGKAELVRRAIDFWVTHDRNAKQAAQRLQRRDT